MKRWIFGIGLATALSSPLAAQANNGIYSPSPMFSHMSAQELAAMTTKMHHVESLIEKINHTYHTQFAIAPESESMAMAHMAAANMEMAKAAMEMQEFWSVTPPVGANPAPEGGK